MDRTYQVRIHRDDRDGAQLCAQLYRVTTDAGIKLLADVSARTPDGVGRVFELAGSALITHQQERGEFP